MMTEPLERRCRRIEGSCHVTSLQLGVGRHLLVEMNV